MWRKLTITAASLGLFSLVLLLWPEGPEGYPIPSADEIVGSANASDQPSGPQVSSHRGRKSVYSPPRRADPGLTVSERVREEFKRPVEALEPDPVGRIVQAALYDPDPKERKYAISELAMIDEMPRLWKVCLKALEDQDFDVRIEAVLALENFGDRSLGVLQTVATADPSMEVREAALDTVESVQRPRPVLRSEE